MAWHILVNSIMDHLNHLLTLHTCPLAEFLLCWQFMVLLQVQVIHCGHHLLWFIDG